MQFEAALETNLDMTVVSSGYDESAIEGHTPDSCQMSLQGAQTPASLYVPQSEGGVPGSTHRHLVKQGDAPHSGRVTQQGVDNFARLQIPHLPTKNGLKSDFLKLWLIVLILIFFWGNNIV